MPSSAVSSPIRRAQRTILVADLVESVRLIEQDEEGTIQRWRGFVAAVTQGPLVRHGGRLIKSLGDGLLVEFEQVLPAVRCAFEMHALMRSAASGLAEQQAMMLRIGLHVADVIVDAHDVYGSGVNLAARLSTRANPGEVVVSLAVCDNLVLGLDAEVEDLGPCYFKHIERPVRAFRIRGPNELAPTVPVPVLDDSGDLLPTIAVIPFEPRGVDPAMHCVGDLIADAVIVQLCRNPALRVVSRLSSGAFRGRVGQGPQLQQHLGASFALSGSYVVQGHRLLVNAELCDLTTDRVLWADRLAGELDDLLQVECDLATRFAAAVASAALVEAVASARAQALPNLPSYALQLGAITLMHRHAGDDFNRVRQMLEHLIERHPRQAAQRAWIAKWHVLRVTRGIVPDGRLEADVALDHTRRALDADPGCSLAMAMQGFVQCHMLRDLPTAMSTLQQAIALNPSESLAWLFKGVVHGLWGEGTQALSAAQEARRLSPLDPLRHYYDSLASTAALSAGEYELAREWAQRSLHGNRLHSPTLRALAIAQSELGRIEEAEGTVRELLTLDPGLTVSSYLARSPAGDNEVRRRYADALHRAGLPLH